MTINPLQPYAPNNIPSTPPSNEVLVSQVETRDATSGTTPIINGSPLLSAPVCEDLPTQKLPDFVESQNRQNGEGERLVNEARRTIDDLAEFSTDYPIARNDTVFFTSQRGEGAIIQWLAASNLGQTQPENRLGGAIDDLGPPDPDLNVEESQEGIGRRAFWYPLIAMILSSDLAAYSSELQSLTTDDSWASETDPRERELQALAQIETQFLAGHDEFSLLLGENLLRQAQLIRSLALSSNDTELLAESRRLLGLARGYISRIATTDTISRDSDSAYIPRQTRGNDAELARHFARANLLMANVIMLEAQGEATLLTLREAETYLCDTAALEGFEALEARRLLADNLIQQGYLSRDQNEPYLLYFEEAITQLNYVIEWENAYQNSEELGASPRWLLSIATSARIARVNLLMSLAGEINLEADLTTEPTLQEQRTILEEAENDLGRALEITYPPGSENYLITYQERLGLRLALLESRVRQAFISRTLDGDNQPFNLVELTGIIESPDTSPQTLALANLWMAKLLLINAGDALTVTASQETLASALTYLQSALDSEELHGSLLSSAYQVQGEIFLAQAEAQMRRLNYTLTSITNLETIAFDILDQEPAGSPIIMRAINALIEAYGSYEPYQQRIIHLCNTILGESAATSVSWAIPFSISTVNFPERFLAELYLKLAEVVSWGGEANLTEAQAILSRIPSNYQTIIENDSHLIIQGQLLAAELSMRLAHLQEETIEAPIFADDDFRQTVFEIGNLDLIKRFILDQIEYYLYQENYTHILEVVDNTLNQTIYNGTTLETLFNTRGLSESYASFSRDLRQTRVDAYTWDEQFDNAINETALLLEELATDDSPEVALARARLQLNLGNIYLYEWDGQDYRLAEENFDRVLTLGYGTNGEAIPPDELPMETRRLMAQAHIQLGNISLWEINDRDQSLAEISFNGALGLLNGDYATLSGNTRLILAQAHFGLGEFYRYVNGEIDFDLSQQHYTDVLTILRDLPAPSLASNILLIRAYLGLAKLNSLPDGNLGQAAYYIIQARERLDSIDDEDRPAGLGADINRTYGELGRSNGINWNTTTEAFTIVLPGNDDHPGNITETEYRVQSQLNIPLNFISDYINLLISARLALNEAGGYVLSPYLGLEGAYQNEDWALSLGMLGRLFSYGTAQEMHIYLPQDLLTRASFRLDGRFIAEGELNIGEYGVGEMNSWRTSLTHPFSWTDSLWLRELQAGVEYSSYPYFWNEFHRTDFWRAGLRYGLDVSNLVEIPLHLQLSTMAFRYNSEFETYDSVTDTTYTEEVWRWGGEINLGAQISLPHTQFSLNGGLQCSADNCNYTLTGGLGFNFGPGGGSENEE